MLVSEWKEYCKNSGGMSCCLHFSVVQVFAHASDTQKHTNEGKNVTNREWMSQSDTSSIQQFTHKLDTHRDFFLTLQQKAQVLNVQLNHSRCNKKKICVWVQSYIKSHPRGESAFSSFYKTSSVDNDLKHTMNETPVPERENGMFPAGCVTNYWQ